MGRRKESCEAGGELPRSFSYRGTPGNDFANSIAIIAGSIGMPLLLAWRTYDHYDGAEWMWWSKVLMAVLLFGGAAGCVEGWRRLQSIRRRRARNETITARADGLVFENAVAYVDVPWEQVTAIGQSENTCLVQTSRGVIAFTKDLWGWEALWKIIAHHTPQSVTMMPEEAAEAALRIDYPAATVG